MAGRKGRPPKPAHLKVIDGNPGKRRLAPTVKAPPSRPRAPEWLPSYAKTVWRRLVPLLDEMGILTTVDRETMASYCIAVNKLKESTEALAKTGYLVQGRRKGEAVKNPAAQHQREAMHEIATFSSMFGLSPADRQRLGDPASAAKAGDLETILAGG